MEAKKPFVYIGFPAYGGAEPDAVRSVFRTATKRYPTFANMAPLSLLAMAFNMLWCAAYNRRDEVTHFAMLHGDIVPEPWWIDILMDELNEHGADVVSCVVPLKSDNGLTSTAIDDPECRWQPHARLTMKEVMRLPKTFTAADCGWPDRALLINTGCWLARLDRHWCRDFYFTINDEIFERDDGMLVPAVESEDWFASRLLHERGAKVMATRAVSLNHVGRFGKSNQVAWGEYEFDQERGQRALVLPGG